MGRRLSRSYGLPDPFTPSIKGASIIVLMRFSLVSLHDLPFSRHADLPFEDRAAAVLDDRRLAHRFALFETVALPSWDAQTDPNFRLCVMVSTLLPARWRARLEVLAATREWMSVREIEPEKRYTAAARAFAAIEEPDQDVRRLTVRADDDDAVADDYIAFLRDAAGQVTNGGFAFTWPSGWLIRPRPDRDGFQLVDVREFGSSIGLAYLSARGGDKTIYNMLTKTSLIDSEARTLSDARTPVYLLTAHEQNDSLRNSAPRLLERPVESEEEVRRTLGARFAAVDLKGLLAAAREMKEDGGAIIAPLSSASGAAWEARV